MARPGARKGTKGVGSTPLGIKGQTRDTPVAGRRLRSVSGGGTRTLGLPRTRGTQGVQCRDVDPRAELTVKGGRRRETPGTWVPVSSDASAAGPGRL